jgi:hypothetical protein
VATFAKGRHAIGFCARGGHKLKYRELVHDGRYPWLMVDPAWREEPHPQERLRPHKDPVALKYPAPDPMPAPSAPVLSVAAEQPEAILEWTEALAPASMIESYDVYRSVNTDDGDPGFADSFALLASVEVERGWDGGITNDPYTYTDTTVDYQTEEYHYYVLAVPMQGPAAQSNIVAVPA